MPPTARYVFSYEDYMTLLEAIRLRGRFGFWPFRIFIVAIALFIWLFPYVHARVTGQPVPSLLAFDWEAATGFLVWAGLLLMLEVLLRAPFLYRRAFRRYSAAGQTLTYRLDETGVSWTRDGMRGEFDWHVFKRLTVTADAAVLLIGRNEGMVLPARAFASAQEFEAAVGFIRVKVPAGRSEA